MAIEKYELPLKEITPISEGGTGATTPAKALENLGALPLSGGKMTGTIVFDEQNNNFFASCDDDASQLNIIGGNKALAGAAISLKGINDKRINGEEGGFFIAATDGTKAHLLAGLKNGELWWDGKQIRFVSESWSDGYSYYRMYNDGWIEQGGWIPANDVANIKRKTLLVPIDISRGCTLNLTVMDTDAYIDGVGGYLESNTTLIYGVSNGGLYFDHAIQWEAKGWRAD